MDNDFWSFIVEVLGLVWILFCSSCHCQNKVDKHDFDLHYNKSNSNLLSVLGIGHKIHNNILYATTLKGLTNASNCEYKMLPTFTKITELQKMWKNNINIILKLNTWKLTSHYCRVASQRKYWWKHITVENIIILLWINQ